jgi:hypothetical protein
MAMSRDVLGFLREWLAGGPKAAERAVEPSRRIQSQLREGPPPIAGKGALHLYDAQVAIQRLARRPAPSDAIPAVLFSRDDRAGVIPSPPHLRAAPVGAGMSPEALQALAAIQALRYRRRQIEQAIADSGPVPSLEQRVLLRHLVAGAADLIEAVDRAAPPADAVAPASHPHADLDKRRGEEAP